MIFRHSVFHLNPSINSTRQGRISRFKQHMDHTELFNRSFAEFCFTNHQQRLLFLLTINSEHVTWVSGFPYSSPIAIHNFLAFRCQHAKSVAPTKKQQQGPTMGANGSSKTFSKVFGMCLHYRSIWLQASPPSTFAKTQRY